MKPDRNPEPWRERARQNAKAASLLSARSPCLPMPAVSRLYYACFQAVIARLLELGRACRIDNHGEVWRSADQLRAGLGSELQDLYGWRRKADYAAGGVTERTARQLMEQHLGTCAWLGIEGQG